MNSEIENLEKFNFEFFIFKNVVRVLKEHRYYAMFMKVISFKTNNIFDELVELKTRKNIRSSFSNCSNLEHLFEKMLDCIGRDIDLNSKDEYKTQMTIAKYVNALLHECVEPYLTEQINMEKLGLMCFNSCCEELYGKGFKDVTESGNTPNDNIQRLIKQTLDYYSVDDVSCLNNEIRQRLIRVCSEIASRDNAAEYGDGDDLRIARPSEQQLMRWSINPF